MSESKKSPSKKSNVKRTIKGEQDIHHDLFRLENAITKKNVAYGKHPIWEPVEHKHFFHSVDSDGKPQEKSAPSNGHFHYIGVEEKDGELIATCSEPYTMERGGKAIPYKNDSHTHNVTYMQSEVVKQRVFSKDAMSEISRIQSEQAQRLKNPAV